MSPKMTQMVGSVPDESTDYYYGNISRETAEWILWDRGCQDGLFLLRDSNTDYVLSLCHQKSILHYRITKIPNGEVMLQGLPGQKFQDMDSLIKSVDGLATKPALPCDKTQSCILPPTHWGLNINGIRGAILQKSREWGFDGSPFLLIPTQETHLNHPDDIGGPIFVYASELTKTLISKTLHEIQPWFHGRLTRIEAENRIEESGHKDGKFLVRERDDCSYALCVSHEGTVKHYRIDILPSDEFAIQDGQVFPSILALVSHYTVFTDGLWCSLGEPCPKPSSVLIQSNLSPGGRTCISNGDIVHPTLRPNSGLRRNFQKTSQHLPHLQQQQHRYHQIPGSSSPQNQMNNNNRSSSRISAINCSSNNSNGTLRLRDWQNTINQKWTQLLSAVSSKHWDGQSSRLLGNTSSSGAANTTQGPGHRFSTLPRNHHLLSSSLSTANGSNNLHHLQLHSYEDTSQVFRMQHELLSSEANSQVNSSMEAAASATATTALPKVASGTSTTTALPKVVLGTSTTTALPKVASGTSTPPPIQPKLGSVKASGDSIRQILGTLGDLDSLQDPMYDCDTIRFDGNSLAKEASLGIASLEINKSGSQIQLNELDLICLDEDPEVISKTVTEYRHGALALDPNCITFHKVFRVQHDLLSSEANSQVNSSMEAETAEATTAETAEATTAETAEATAAETATATAEATTAETAAAEATTATTEAATVTTEASTATAEAATTLPKVASGTSTPPPIQPKLGSVKASGNSIRQILESLGDQDSLQDPMYDYDTIRFDRNSLAKQASLGIASLERSKSGSQIQLNELDLICLDEDPDAINKTVTKYRHGALALDPNYITFHKRLGIGYFGEVYLGTIPSCSAVKVLKSHAVPNHETEILKEAQTMASLDHKHIVRLIGVCEGDPFMLVMELAPLGPLHQFLIDQGDQVSLNDILTLLLQVAMAMQYLESKQFIHRDLAARNVLLVNERYAKISDFGMSRALGIGKEYYKARTASKWPLKWYAPECIYYFKFSTKSDVWSYGVTLWEAISYGQKPYEGMDGQDILRLFRENRRLPKPDNCPDDIYDLMWRCWQFREDEKEDDGESG